MYSAAALRDHLIHKSGHKSTQAQRLRQLKCALSITNKQNAGGGTRCLSLNASNVSASYNQSKRWPKADAYATYQVGKASHHDSDLQCCTYASVYVKVGKDHVNSVMAPVMGAKY